jgi:hypothetical protein
MTNEYELREMELRAEMAREAEIESAPYDGGGWGGDGSGTDDLADYNANEADDYRDEGCEDYHLEAAYEDANGCGFDGE